MFIYRAAAHTAAEARRAAREQFPSRGGIGDGRDRLRAGDDDRHCRARPFVCGSLYQFFPNMLSLAEALRNQYVGDVEESWIALGRQAAAMNAEKLTCRLVELQVEIMKNYPVLLTLLDVPPISHARRELIRTRIAEVLLAHQPLLCAQAGAVTDEFKAALTGYLVPKLKA